jgi:hypothetical protein
VSAGLPLELWLPAHQRFSPAHPLQRLLARADRLDHGPRGYLAGLQHYFSCTGAQLPAAALTRQQLAGDADDALWLSADPCWVQAEMNGARLLACGQLGLDMEQAQALAQPLRPVFGDAGMQLELSSPDRWHLRLPGGSPIPTFAAPEQALGEDLFQHLPQGPKGRRWRVLINEIQVLLHQHPLNSDRRAQGLPPVNSLWLWGGGVLPHQVSTRWASVVSDDLLLQALARKAGVACQSRSADAVRAAQAGTLVDLQDLPVAQIEQDWWPTLDELLRRQPVTLAFADGGRWRHGPWHRLRFWRAGRAR